MVNEVANTSISHYVIDIENKYTFNTEFNKTICCLWQYIFIFNRKTTQSVKSLLIHDITSVVTCSPLTKYHHVYKTNITFLSKSIKIKKDWQNPLSLCW